MKKIKFIAMAMLALLTAQCKKNEPKPEEKVMVPISGSVSFGGGSKTEITTDGYVTPKSGDKIYIYNNVGTCVGSLDCAVPPTKGQEFTCSGTIDKNYLGETCTFMYLGSENGTNGNSESINFANQTGINANSGKISGIDKFHVGSCKATVYETGISLPMRTKISIAYFKLTDGTSPIDNKVVTISGVSATATINKTDGTLTGVPGDITVQTDANGCFYMALVPKSGAVTFSFAVDGKDGSNVFPYGIGECSFYSEQGNVSKPLQVAVKPKPKFTVRAGTTVEFAPGNLYYNGADDSHKMNQNLPSGWNFYSNQWDCYPSGTSSVTESMEISMFTWGYDSWSTDYSTTDYQTGTGVTMVDWGTAPGLPSAGGGKSWRTLSKAEWQYLLYSRANASSLRAWKELDNGTHKGLVFLPDGTEYPSTVLGSITKTSDLATHGAVFLPAAGYRNGTNLSSVGTDGYYWSSTPVESQFANDIDFWVNGVCTYPHSRNSGCPVRLVSEN